MTDRSTRKSTEDAPRPEMRWMSDSVAEMLSSMAIPYIAMNPGASYRGLQDSLVNYLGNHDPEILTVLHEEHAVALAHGYAKVTGRAMAVALHSNVGLMHATMAIYNAWVDRAPILMLGATGPVDASRRRPWIDWIHTSRDQAALVRHYVKWDDQPASAPAAIESMLRGRILAETAPQGPVYICLDSALQESRLEAEPVLPDLDRYRPRPSPVPSPALLDRAAALLDGAARPVLLVGRVSRSRAAWDDRVELAERLGAQVMTDINSAAGFPTLHGLHCGPPSAGQRLSPEQREVLGSADVILALDCLDLGGLLRQAAADDDGSKTQVIATTLQEYVANGWSLDHCSVAPIDCALAAGPDEVVAELLNRLYHRERRIVPQRDISRELNGVALEGDIDLRKLAVATQRAMQDHKTTLLRLPSGWPLALADFKDPLAYIGKDGGAGIGSGPGMSIGAALALRDSGRLPVAVLGDGNLLMGVNALWTAARYRIPLLIVVANNGGYFNDVRHQEAVATARCRAVENKWVGQEIADPAVDVPAIARAMGFAAPATVAYAQDLLPALRKGLAAVADGSPYLIDVTVVGGY